MRLYNISKIIEKLQEFYSNETYDKPIKVVEDEDSQVRISIVVRQSRTGRKYVAWLIRGLPSGRDIVVLPQDMRELLSFITSLSYSEFYDKFMEFVDYVNSEYVPRRQRFEEDETVEEISESKPESKPNSKRGGKR